MLLARQVATSKVVLALNQPIKSLKYLLRPVGCVLYCAEYFSECRMVFYTPFHGRCDIVSKFYLVDDTSGGLFNETIGAGTMAFIIT